jgi:hypothetical protein
MQFEKHESELLWKVEQAGEAYFRVRRRNTYINIVAGLGFLILWLVGGQGEDLSYMAWLGALWLLAAFYEHRLSRRDRLVLKLSQRLTQENTSWMVETK